MTDTPNPNPGTPGGAVPTPPPTGGERFSQPGSPAPQVPGHHGAANASYAPQAAAVPQPASPSPASPPPPAYQATASPGHKPPKKGGNSAKVFLLGFAGAALACAIALAGVGIYNMATHSSGGSSSTTLGSVENKKVESDGSSQTMAEAVAKKALPSVVAIDVYTKQAPQNMYGFGGGGGGSDALTESSLGSGVILSKDGYIVTNNHVVEGADSLKVTVGGEQYEANVVGTDPSSDLAVVKLKDAPELTPVELGSSSDLIIGEWVMTIGSPFGLEQSVATGIVSATSRSQIMQSQTGGSAAIYTNLIQTDAAINPGNSGGALVDAEGKLIGINTLITSYSGNYSGVGFAIPVDYAVNIAQQIIDGKTPTHAQLGVSLTNVDAQIAKRYGLAVDKGAYVSQVSSGSGAEAAGIVVGDIITKFNDKAVTSASDLMLDVRSLNPGDKVTLEVNRDGKPQSVEVTLGSDAASAPTQQEGSRGQQDKGQGNGSGSDWFDRLFGGGSSGGPAS